MSFFVTSQNPGKGGDLGGLEGADAYCKSLATAAGASADKNWRAYLSTDAENAKDRIGAGPWYNAKGEKIADDVASLHSDGNNITKQTALDETGRGHQRPWRHAQPPRHPDRLDAGRHRRSGNLRQLDDGRRRRRSDGRPSRPHGAGRPCRRRKSWNPSHASRGGCSQEAFKGTGGDGLFYCFAAN